MGKILMALTSAVMIMASCFGNSLFNSMAQEEQRTELYRYYKSITIESGDSLWSIADEYNTHYSMDNREYVHELKKMNCLREDTIHTGQYLTVLYFSEEKK